VHKPWEDLDLKIKVKNAADGLYLERLTRQQNRELNDLNENLAQKVEQRTAEVVSARDQLQKAYEELNESYSGIVKMLCYYSSLSTPSLGNHGERVAKLVTQFSRYIRLDESAAKEVETAALLHDIGLTVISDEILATPVAERTDEQNSIIEKHAILGESTLMGLPSMHGAARMIRHHHERYDGNGYPDGLSGGDIPLGSRIIRLVNDYDDMVSGQGMVPLSMDQALTEIKKHTPEFYDPKLVGDFCAMILNGSDASTGAGGLILAVHSDDLQPGMLLHQNLLNRDGILMLTAGQRLTLSSIKGIRRLEQGDGQRYTLYIQG